MTFASFKRNRAVFSMFKKLDAHEILSAAANMDALRISIHHSPDEGFWLYKRAETLYPTLDAGEKLILEAILMKLDFSGLADDLGNGSVWSRLADAGFADVSGEHTRALWSCIAADLK